MIRAFIAADLPGAVLDGCSRIIGDLKELGVEGRFVRTGSIHLTLKFLGHIEEEKVETIGRLLDQAAAGISRFEIGIRRVGAFPNLTRPRVVWVGVESNQELTALQAKVEEALEGQGFARDERGFKPHLTLLRLKSRRNTRELARYIDGQGAVEDLGAAPVHRLHLYQSVLKPGGAEYRKLATAELSR